MKPYWIANGTGFESRKQYHKLLNKKMLKLVSSPISAFPDFTKTFIVFTDACDCGVGAVLA